MVARVLIVAAISAAALACGGRATGRPARGEVRLDPPGAGTAERPLPLGKVGNARDVDCGGGTPPGATCTRVDVTCGDLPPLTAEIAVTRAPGSRGTVFVHAGGGGKGYLNEPGTVERYLADGFDVVQARWEDDWEVTPDAGLLRAACRPATLLQHVFETVHRSDRDRGFCAVGHSAGGGLLGYALAHYGAGAVLDYVALASGPPFSRLDHGCAPQTYDGPPRALCPELADAPIELPAERVDGWDNTWSCREPEPHPDDLARWKADSIVSPGADFSYPRTFVDFYDCATRPNGTAGGAFLYAREIATEKDVTCFTDCAIEELREAGWGRIADGVKEKCVPRHGKDR